MHKNVQHTEQDHANDSNKSPLEDHNDDLKNNQSLVATFLQAQGKQFISIIIIIIILIILIVFASINLNSTEQENKNVADREISENPEETLPDSTGTDTAATTFFDPLNSTGLSTIIERTTPGIISLINEDGLTERTLSEGNAQILTDALYPYTTNNVPVGFLLLNLNTGYGIAYNIDTEIYGASTFKAAYVLYICQNLLETGIRTLDDNITYYLQDEYDQSYYAYGTNSLRDTIYDCIVESDNGAYVALRKEFDSPEFDTWLASFDCNVKIEEGSYFPTYDVRNASKIWLEIYNYFNTDTEIANFFKSLLTQTQTSFLREALSDYEGIEVADKAGWYDSGDEVTGIYDCVNDAGIITFEETAYLFCMMTAIADNDITENDFETLAGALFSERDQLTDAGD